MANLKKTIIVIIIIIIISIFVVGSMIRIIPAGSVHVLTRFGKVTGKVLYPGLNFILPFINNTISYNTKKIIYETTAEARQGNSRADYIDFPVDTNTKDGQQVNIYYTVRFSVDSNKVTWIANNIGRLDDIVERIVKTESRIWIRNIPREFNAEQLYTGNVQEVQIRIEDKLSPVYNDNGIILDSVGIREIKFAEEYVKAIEAKQIEAVKIEAEKNKAEQAKYQKEARITQAEGQAREQELQRTTITPQLIQKLWIEKWNGILPTVMGQGTTLMDITEMISKK
ncbi:MAG: prohibitin family protein [Spirochaetes bacterium]|nr:prohibitin family protein [Spirochaetota bacterium]